MSKLGLRLDASTVYWFVCYRCVVEYPVWLTVHEWVDLFREEDIPWADIAFPVVYHTLREFFHDRKVASWPVRVSAIRR